MPALTARERRRLQQAHENGFLDATCADPRSVVKAHGLWCWRLKVPMVWFERPSPRSRFAVLRLDMLTTPNRLTVAGQAALRALGQGEITAHDALWESVPQAKAEKMAHAALRAAIQVANYRVNRAPVAKIGALARKALKLVPRKRVRA